MPNDTSNRNPSESAQQMTLRIPTAPPTVTTLLAFSLLFLFIAGALPNDGVPLLSRMGVQADAIIDGVQLHRLLTGLLVLPYRPGNTAVNIFFALVSLYTLYIVGNSTERLWGNARFALVYGLGGVTGTVVTVLATVFGLRSAEVFYAAAPGAILAILGAEFIYMRRHNKLYAQRGRQRRMYLGGLAGTNLLLVLFVGPVDIFGAVGGLVGGAALAWYIAPEHLPRLHPDESGTLFGEDVNPLRGRWVTVLLYFTVVLALLTAAFYIAT